MSVSKLKDLLEEFKEEVQTEEKKEAKRIPFNKKWEPKLKQMKSTRERMRKIVEQMKELAQEGHELSYQNKAEYRAFWSMVEQDTKEYRDMTYDEKTKEIIVYEM